MSTSLNKITGDMRSRRCEILEVAPIDSRGNSHGFKRWSPPRVYMV